MSFRLLILLGFAAPFLCLGCSRPPAPLARATVASARLPDSVRIDWINDSKPGRRTVKLIYDGPFDRQTVETALRQTFEFYREEILANEADSQFAKRVFVRLCSSELESEAENSFAEYDSGNGDSILPWDPSLVRLVPRDAATRPSKVEESIVRAMTRCERDARLQAEREFKGRTNVDGAESRRADEIRAKLKSEYLAAEGLTEEDYRRANQRWLLWTSGFPATDAAVDEQLRLDRELDAADR